MTTTPATPSAAFAVPAEAYDALMGRYLPTLAPAFADAAGVRSGCHALDVGCGPGGLTTELVARLGADAVSAVDPSPPFVRACRQRHPGVDVRVGVAEDLPFTDRSFDITLASLVVGFMTDPPRGIGEIARVTTPGGTVATCFWDLTRMPTLNTYWDAAASVEGRDSCDLRRPGSQPGELGAFLRQAGLTDLRETVLTATARYADFDDWWRAFALGVGPAGQHCRSLREHDRDAVRRICRERLGKPTSAFTLTAHAWCAVGNVAGQTEA